MVCGQHNNWLSRTPHRRSINLWTTLFTSNENIIEQRTFANYTNCQVYRFSRPPYKLSSCIYRPKGWIFKYTETSVSLFIINWGNCAKFRANRLTFFFLWNKLTSPISQVPMVVRPFLITRVHRKKSIVGSLVKNVSLYGPSVLAVRWFVVSWVRTFFYE